LWSRGEGILVTFFEKKVTKKALPFFAKGQVFGLLAQSEHVRKFYKGRVLGIGTLALF
jgi:hypothetical protein